MLEHLSKALDMTSNSLSKPPPAKEQPVTTPWDKRIAAFEEQAHYGGLNADGRAGLSHHRTLAEGYRRGYADAQAEDAPLLEALKALMPLQEDTETHQAYEAEFKAAEEAIAAAEGRE